MNESQWTTKFLRALRAQMPEAVVTKHSDRISAGVPDFSVTKFDGVAPYARVTWVEVKLAGAPSAMFRPLQAEMLKRLGGWYIVWSPKARKAWLFRADERERWHDEPGMLFNELVERIRRFF